MIGNDVKVSKSGEVTGTIKYISDVKGYDSGHNDGHFFPTMFEKKNYDKTLHVGGKPSDDGFTAGKDFTPSEKDPYLVIRVENCTDGNKVTVYDKETKAELFTIDFNKATLEQKPTKIKASAKTPVASVLEVQEEPMQLSDDDVSISMETNEEKRYTKSEINRMTTADLQTLAAEKGVENAHEMTGTELKALLVEMLVN